MHNSFVVSSVTVMIFLKSNEGIHVGSVRANFDATVASL